MSNIGKQALRGLSVESPFYLAECCNCGEIMPSGKLRESRNYPDDDGECHCPHCNADDCDIADLGAVGSQGVTAWNYQQKRIEALLDELEAKDSRNAEQVVIIAKQEKWIKDVEATMIAATDRAEAAERRTITVKLPADYHLDDGSLNADMMNTCAVVGAFREALAAAGITVKGADGGGS